MTRLSLAVSLLALVVAVFALGLSWRAYRHQVAPVPKPESVPRRVEPVPADTPAPKDADKDSKTTSEKKPKK